MIFRAYVHITNRDKYIGFNSVKWVFVFFNLAHLYFKFHRLRNLENSKNKNFLTQFLVEIIFL